MKYELYHMSPKGNFDVNMSVKETPSWYDCFSTFTIKRYYGSGSTWWEATTDRRVDGWTSAILHDLWNNEMNKQLEKNNCSKI